LIQLKYMDEIYFGVPFRFSLVNTVYRIRYFYPLDLAGIYEEGRTFKVELRRACQTESVDKILCPAHFF
jgi:hypothetical protein